MRFTLRFASIATRLALVWLAAVSVAASGCDARPEHQATGSEKSATEKPVPARPLIPVAEALDWCREHAMPESVCVQCKPELAASFKQKGDWCKEHDRPESQCFECHPELKDRFVSDFKARYGKEPPAAASDANHK
ncbi:MAG: RND transporter [Planctomycetota bacterium]